MKCYVSVVCVLSVLVALGYAAPMPQSQGSGAVSTQQIAMQINDKIKLLRQYCPQIFQVIDNVIQNVTSTAFRVIGRVILQSGGLGGGGGGGSSGGGSRVSVVLPTFGPDDDDYDEEEEDEETNAVSSSSISPVSIEASTSTTESISALDSNAIDSVATKISEAAADDGVDTIPSSTLSTTTTIDNANIRISLPVYDDVKLNILDATKTDNDVPVLDNETLYTSPASESSRTKRDVVRKTRATEQAEDQEAAASGGNDGPNPSEDLSNVDADDADRDKRFLPFGGTFGASAGGSTGGSGNFLFDIIRRTADGAARAAGTVYRMIAGTDTLGLGLTASASSTRTLTPQLVAGSGATEDSDEKENAPLGAGGIAEIDVAKGADGYTEGIPGPITRLFVLANRGLANLVQDLILRLAQTSERIVNFKARLVTALI